jgi:uncharacterized membrane-anchored protein
MDRRLRFAAVIAVQLAVLAAVPARQVLARARGREITLRTAPVDPFSPFGGYYLTLAYEVERPVAGKLGPGVANGGLVYVVVQEGKPAWTLVSISREPPAGGPDRAVLRARWRGGPSGSGALEPWERATIESAGRFYLPEAKARVLEKAMADEWKRVNEIPWQEREAVQRTRMLVDLRVDDDGNVALVRLRYGGLSFEE